MPSNFIFRSLDAILTAHLGPRHSSLSLLGAMLGPRTGNYRRLSSAVSLFDRVAPGVSKRLSLSLIDPRRMPFKTANIRPLAYGTGQTVFLLESDRGKKVLKVVRRSLGSRSRAAIESARWIENYRRLQAWFCGHQLVVPSHFLVLHSPLLGASAVAVLQPFIDGAKTDIFRDYSIPEAVRLLTASPGLRSQWLGFAAGVFRSVEQEGRCFDMVGRQNLILTEHEGQLAFRIADLGTFDLKDLRLNAPQRYAKLQRHLEHARLITEAI